MIPISRGVPICGFTGVNGAGKSLLAVSCAIADLQDGREVYSTVPISSPAGEARPIKSVGQLLELRDCTVLLDDVAVIFSARSTANLPPAVVTFLQTVRHRNVTILWTAPAWMRCDVLLRSVTQALVTVSPLLTRVDKASPWPRPGLVMAGLLDTTSTQVDGTPTRVLRRRLYRPKNLAGWGAYDSQADTPQLGYLDAGTICIDCGGSITRPKHSHERHLELGIS
jgi:hypothetical protein